MPESETINFKAVNYTELIPIVIKAMQVQDKKIIALETENAQMKQDLQNCCLSHATTGTNERIKTQLTDKPLLEQNNPNPFNQSTVIRYQLSGNSNNGRIIIRDLEGNSLKSFSLTQNGKGQVTINANELASGTYTYTLVVNGNSIDTKLMVVTK